MLILNAISTRELGGADSAVAEKTLAVTAWGELITSRGHSMDAAEIDSIELVRSIRDRLNEETRGMSDDELQAFITREAAKVAGSTTPPSGSSDRPAA